MSTCVAATSQAVHLRSISSIVACCRISCSSRGYGVLVSSCCSKSARCAAPSCAKAFLLWLRNRGSCVAKHCRNSYGALHPDRIRIVLRHHNGIDLNNGVAVDAHSRGRSIVSDLPDAEFEDPLGG